MEGLDFTSGSKNAFIIGAITQLRHNISKKRRSILLCCFMSLNEIMVK